ncbi:MAG: hypothetical protein U9P73_06905 [Candidatus Cloacimonadota bacterium]|nr:hypothetical protein [Candidatus Cloacimonadota bacterium]
MKKLLLLMSFVFFVFINFLNSVPELCNNWTVLSYSSDYPKYEEVGKLELTEAQKHDYKRKRQGLSVTSDHNYKFVSETRRNPQTNFEEQYVTFKDESGNVLWSMESTNEDRVSRRFYVSSIGITAICDYNMKNSLFWVDKQGNELNRLELKDQQTAYASTLKDGEIWMIETGFDIWSYEEPRELPNLASLIFCDRHGKILNSINLKYAKPYHMKAVSKSNNSIIFTCYQDIYNGNEDFTRDYYSYLLKHNGKIIKEYEGKVIANGIFSEDEDLYIDKGSSSDIIDVATGELIISFKTHGRSAVANKDTKLIAVLDYENLRVINYQTKEILFHKKIDVYPYPDYLEITGDGKEILVVTKDYLYTFRMKE